MHHDLAIIGAGLGGSITALIAKQMGMNPVLIERGKHPRFTIGESSTPQADIALASIAEKYDLPRLAPLARYGSWKETYPQLNCGPKRGFTYIHHPDTDKELLVAASPDISHSDSHWYREDLDAFLVNEVQEADIAYFDETDLTTFDQGNQWTLESADFSCTADFLIDATGGANPLNIPQNIQNIRTNSRVLYAHFKDVAPWSDIHAKPTHPYPCHEAALHHVFNGGWMYVLHFDNGITSAGFVLDAIKNPLNESMSPEAEWHMLMDAHPSIKEQFQNAVPVMPLVRTGRMQRCATQMVGENWAMLPYAAAFLDPLHSAGNAHTLCGIERLMPILEAPKKERGAKLIQYAETTFREVDLLDKMIHGCYVSFDDFEILSKFSMLYFAGADFTERQRRAGKASGFLNSNDAAFCDVVDSFYQQIVDGTIDVSKIEAAIEPWNFIGLCDPAKQNMYDYA